MSKNVHFYPILRLTRSLKNLGSAIGAPDIRADFGDDLVAALYRHGKTLPSFPPFRLNFLLIVTDLA